MPESGGPHRAASMAVDSCSFFFFFYRREKRKINAQRMNDSPSICSAPPPHPRATPSFPHNPAAWLQLPSSVICPTYKLDLNTSRHRRRRRGVIRNVLFHIDDHGTSCGAISGWTEARGKLWGKTGSERKNRQSGAGTTWTRAVR